MPPKARPVMKDDTAMRGSDAKALSADVSVVRAMTAMMLTVRGTSFSRNNLSGRNLRDVAGLSVLLLLFIYRIVSFIVELVCVIVIIHFCYHLGCLLRHQC